LGLPLGLGLAIALTLLLLHILGLEPLVNKTISLIIALLAAKGTLIS
jgi:hypothetical protein